LLQVFEQAQIPDVAGAPFVTIRPLEALWVAGEPTGGPHGFLLETDDTWALVLDLDLAPREVELELFATEPADLSAYARGVLGRCRPGDAARQDVQTYAGYEEVFDPGVDHVQRLLTLAWACERQGHHQLAARLVHKATIHQAATSAPDDLLQDFAHRVAIQLRAQICTELARGRDRSALASLAAAAAGLGPPGVFPTTELADLAEQLEAMAAEDLAHPPRHEIDLGELPLQERIEELVYRLRDLAVEQWDQPGHCDLLSGGWDEVDGSEDPGDPHPAWALIRHGKAAVPRLLDLLTDWRPTRSYGYDRFDDPASYVLLRLCDAAEAILEQITNRTFPTYERRDDTYLSRTGDPEETARRYRAWWREARQQPRLAWFQEDLSSENLDLRLHAIRSLLQDPDSLHLDAIAGAIEGVEEPWACIALVGILEAAPAPFQVEQLTALQARAPWYVQAYTARRLLALGAPIELDDFRRGLRDLVERGASPWGVWALREAIDVLLEDDSDDSRTLLRSLLEYAPATWRPEVYWAIADAAEVEPLLLSLLALPATGPRPLTAGSWQDLPYTSPRRRDLAAMVLAYRLGVVDQYVWTGSDRQRDRQIHDLRNRWRAIQGLRPLPDPDPPPPVIPRHLVERHQPGLLAADPTRRHHAQREVAALGPGVVPTLLAMADGADPRTRQALLVAAHVAVNTVRAVTVTGVDEVPPGAPLLQEPLEVQTLGDLHEAWFARRPDCRELQLEVDRSVDRGIEITITLRHGEPATAGTVIYSSTGASGDELLTRATAGGDLADAAAELDLLLDDAAGAFSATIDLPIHLSWRAVREEP
jgi:hypothetical protein